jgi:hypothetical protein
MFDRVVPRFETDGALDVLVFLTARGCERSGHIFGTPGYYWGVRSYSIAEYAADTRYAMKTADKSKRFS